MHAGSEGCLKTTPTAMGGRRGGASRKEGLRLGRDPGVQPRGHRGGDRGALGTELTGPRDGLGVGSVGLLLRGLRCFGLHLCRQ